ncbi:MAG TPA: hypothetical protein PKD53_14700 [Chloroflexaceae bacterium]|nr:hypothetical protein [Chloroflexaceae bacterium]
MLEHLVIRHTDHPQTVRGDNAITLPIVVSLALMDSAVHLDDQLGGVTVEVGNETVYNLLPPKFPAVEASAAQVLPQQSFSLRHCATQRACTLQLPG